MKTRSSTRKVKPATYVFESGPESAPVLPVEIQKKVRKHTNKTVARTKSTKKSRKNEGINSATEKKVSTSRDSREINVNVTILSSEGTTGNSSQPIIINLGDVLSHMNSENNTSDNEKNYTLKASVQCCSCLKKAKNVTVHQIKEGKIIDMNYHQFKPLFTSSEIKKTRCSFERGNSKNFKASCRKQGARVANEHETEASGLELLPPSLDIETTTGIKENDQAVALPSGRKLSFDGIITHNDVNVHDEHELENNPVVQDNNLFENAAKSRTSVGESINDIRSKSISVDENEHGKEACTLDEEQSSSKSTSKQDHPRSSLQSIKKSKLIKELEFVNNIISKRTEVESEILKIKLSEEFRVSNSIHHSETGNLIDSASIEPEHTKSNKSKSDADISCSAILSEETQNTGNETKKSKKKKRNSECESQNPSKLSVNVDNDQLNSTKKCSKIIKTSNDELTLHENLEYERKAVDKSKKCSGRDRNQENDLELEEKSGPLSECEPRIRIRNEVLSKEFTSSDEVNKSSNLEKPDDSSNASNNSCHTENNREEMNGKRQLHSDAPGDDENSSDNTVIFNPNLLNNPSWVQPKNRVEKKISGSEKSDEDQESDMFIMETQNVNGKQKISDGKRRKKTNKSNHITTDGERTEVNEVRTVSHTVENNGSKLERKNNENEECLSNTQNLDTKNKGNIEVTVNESIADVGQEEHTTKKMRHKTGKNSESCNDKNNPELFCLSNDRMLTEVLDNKKFRSEQDTAECVSPEQEIGTLINEAASRAVENNNNDVKMNEELTTKRTHKKQKSSKPCSDENRINSITVSGNSSNPLSVKEKSNTKEGSFDKDRKVGVESHKEICAQEDTCLQQNEECRQEIKTTEAESDSIRNSLARKVPQENDEMEIASESLDKFLNKNSAHAQKNNTDRVLESIENSQEKENRNAPESKEKNKGHRKRKHATVHSDSSLECEGSEPEVNLKRRKGDEHPEKSDEKLSKKNETLAVKETERRFGSPESKLAEDVSDIRQSLESESCDGDKKSARGKSVLRKRKSGNGRTKQDSDSDRIDNMTLKLRLIQLECINKELKKRKMYNDLELEPEKVEMENIHTEPNGKIVDNRAVKEVKKRKKLKTSQKKDDMREKKVSRQEDYLERRCSD